VEEDEIVCVNFSIISSDLTQDAHASVRGFRILRQQEFFKSIVSRDIIVWSDCGKHFRNNEFVGYLLLELAEEEISGKLRAFIFVTNLEKVNLSLFFK
jgi:hypothetical protein